MNLMQLIESKGWSFEYDTEGNQAALITKCGTRIPAETCQFSSPLVRSWTADTFEAIADFLEEYQASTEYVNENNADAAQLIEKFDIVKAAVAEKALPYCNITYIAGADMVEPMDGYLQVLFDQNAESVGGALPGDDFYYEG